MIGKAVRVLYNSIRLIGKNSYRNLLCVTASTVVDISKGSQLTVGKKFRTRRNVEINARDNASIVIGDNVFLNTGCILTARDSITIGSGTIFGTNVQVFDNDHAVENGKVQDNKFETEPVIIGKNVWVGAGSIILKGSIIEDDCIIAAGSVVKGKVGKGTLMVQKRSSTHLPIRGGYRRKVVLKFRILIKVILTKFFMAFPNLITDETHSKLLFRVIFGYTPNLREPKTMNEYICASKIDDRKLDYWIYTDKYEVRKYVERVIGEKYLNPVLGIYNSFDEIDFDKLPDAFALKATHGSSYNVIIPDKGRMDKKRAKKKFDKWLSENFYLKDREKNYKNIVPRIMCDAYLEPKDGQLEEYKLFCFKGKVGFIQHNKQINGGRYDNIFSRDWEVMPVKYGYDGFSNDVKPDNGDELIEVAEKLASQFEFVRVDLYNVDGRIVFSELTFHSGGGLIPFEPREYDRKFGELLGL